MKITVAKPSERYGQVRGFSPEKYQMETRTKLERLGEVKKRRLRLKIKGLKLKKKEETKKQIKARAQSLAAIERTRRTLLKTLADEERPKSILSVPSPFFKR